MSNLGRPVSLNRKNVANACLKHYWSEGIKNVSYNDIIRLSKLSKGSFYKLYKNEDDLQAETLLIYYNHSSDFLNEANECEDLFQLLSVAKNRKYKHNMKYCYFFSCYAEIYRLGENAKLALNSFKKQYKLLFVKVIRKHIKKNKLEFKRLNVKELANYYFYNFVTINLLKRNDIKGEEITMLGNSLLQYTINLSKNLKVAT